MVIKEILISLALFLFGTGILLGQISGNTISQNQTICTGNLLNLTGSIPSGCSGNYQFLWETSTDQISWSNTFVNTQDYQQSVQINIQIYFRRIVYEIGCNNDTSNQVSVLVLPPITQDSIGPNLLRFCMSQGNQFVDHFGLYTSPAGGNGIYSYQWESSPDGINFQSISGQTSNRLNHFFYCNHIDTFYFRRVTNSFTCPPAFSNIGTVMIDSPPPPNLNISASQNLCYGDTPAVLTGPTPVSSFGVYSYVWYFHGQNINYSPVPGGTNASLQLGPATATYLYQRWVVINNCGASYNSVTVFVYPQVFPPTNLQGDTICRPFSAVIRGSPGSGANQIRWFNSLTGGNLVGVGDSLTVTPISTTTYYAESFNTTTGCLNATRIPVVVVVNTVGNPTYQNQVSVCAPDSVTLSATPGAGANSIIWYDAWGNILHYGTPWRVNVLNHTSYRLSSWDSINGCISSIASISILGFNPIGNNIISSDQTICTGTSPVTLTGTTPTGGAFFFNYQWQSSTDLITWTSILPSNTPTYSPGNLTLPTYFRRICSFPPCPAHTSNVISINITPRVTGNTIQVVGGLLSTCVDLPHAPVTGSIPQGGNGNYSYQWFTSHNNGPWGTFPNSTLQNFWSFPWNLFPDTGVYRYYRVVYSGNCPPDTAGPVAYTVLPRVSHLVLSAHQTICSGTAPQAFTSSTPTGGSGNWSQIQWIGGILPNLFPVGFGNPFSPGVLTTTVPILYTYGATAYAGCSTSSCCVNVTVIPPILNNIISSTQTVCPSGSVALLTGSAPTGGGGSFSYQWLSSSDSINWIMTGSTAASFAPPPPAQTVYYRRLVTESGSPCPADSGSTVVVNVIPPIGNNLAGQSQWLCTGMSPQAFSGSQPSGGSGGYQYSWESSANQSSWVPTGGTLPSFVPLQVGWYRRIVLSGSCLPDTSPGVELQIYPPISQNQVSPAQTICSGSVPGLLSGSLPSGAYGNFTFQWESSANQLSWQSVSGASLSDLLLPALTQSGYYRRVAYSGACTDTSQAVSILVLPGLSGNQIGIDQTICSGTTPPAIMGTVPQGGSGLYDYLWESSSDSITWGLIPGETGQGLQPGNVSISTYYRRVVQSLPCSGMASNAILITTQPALGDNTITALQTICSGTAFQAISGSLPSGGNGLYQYGWQSSVNQSNWQTLPGATQQNLNGFVLTQSIYLRRSVTSGACTALQSQSISIHVQPRPGYNVLPVQVSVCNAPGNILLTGTQPNGGNGSFTFIWEQSPDSLTWISIPGATQMNYTGTMPWAATYLRRLVTSGVCPADTAVGMVVLADSTVGNNHIGSDQTLCMGNQPLQLTGSLPSGSLSPPVYAWEMSQDQINWSPASGINTQQQYLPPVLTAHHYFRRIARRGACPSDTSALVTLLVESLPGQNTITTDQSICLGSPVAPLSGSLPTGGSGLYAYQWEQSPDALTWSQIPSATNQTYAPGLLNSGAYFRRWVHSGICPDAVSNTVRIQVEVPAGPNTISASHTLCSGQNGQWLAGSLPGGGNGSWQYQWQSSLNQAQWQNVPQGHQRDLDPGILSQTLFFRRVLSSGVCPSSTSADIKISVFPTPDLQVIGLNLCPGQGGYLQAQSSYPGGVWNWSTGGTGSQEWVQPTVATTYSVSYTLGACSSPTLTTAAALYPPITASLLPGNHLPLCPGTTLQLSAGGGFQYEWPGQFSLTDTLTVSAAGTYTVIVTDTNGCKDTARTVIDAVSPMQVQFFVQPPSCHNSLNGLTSVVVQGGRSPYTYSWNTSPVQTTPMLTGLNQGTYTVTVTDAAGCVATRSVGITPPLPLTLLAASDPVPCNPTGTAGTAWVQVSGGTGPYYYNWATSPAQTTATAVGLSAGTYSVSVTDANGCVGTTLVVLLPDVTPSVLASPDTFVCAGLGGINIQANAYGGIPPYIYYWSQSAWVVSGSISDINSPTPTVNPDTSGWYQVTVTGNNGCTSVADSVFVQVIPLPVADAGPDQAYCEGAPGVFLTGNIISPSASYQVQWSPSMGLFCDTCLTTYALPGTTTIYTLRVTDAYGCSSDSTTLNALSSAVVTVKPRPVVSAGRDTAICLGDAAQLGGSSSGAGPMYSWHWSPSAGLNDSTLQMPLASPLHSMIYSVTVVSNGCESESDSVLVSVIPVPVISAGTVRNICRGDSVMLQAIVQQGTAQSYSWSPVNGLNNPALLNPMASPASTTVYHLQASNQGCAAIPDSVLVIVHDVPLAEAGQGFLFCQNGDSVTLNGSFTGGSPPVRYSWSPAYGLDRTDVLNPRCHPDSSMMYYLTVSSGVAPTECKTYDSVFVSIVPGLTARVLTPDTNVLCGGSPIQLQAEGGIGSASYQWWPAQGLSTTQQGTVIATPTQDTRYFVAVSEGGCADTAFVDLFVHPAPEASFSISQANGCVPLEIFTQNLSSNSLSYEWKVTGMSYHSNEKEPMIRFTQAGVYSLHLIVRGLGQCMDSMTLPIPIRVSDQALIIAHTNPPAPIELSLPMSPIQLVDLTPEVHYRNWYFGDGHQEHQDTAYWKWHKAGTYYVTLFVQTDEGCEATKEFGPFVIREPLLFIPNVFSPNNDGHHDRFVIEYDGDEAFYLQIKDRWGNTLFESRNVQDTWDGRGLGGQEVSDGVYFYFFRIGDKEYAGSVTVVR